MTRSSACAFKSMVTWVSMEAHCWVVPWTKLSSLYAWLDAVQVLMEGLDHVPGESCARIVYVTLPEAGRGGKCGQGSLFNTLHYQVGHNHRHRRPHRGTMYLPVYLPSERQVTLPIGELAYTTEPGCTE